MRAAPSRDWQRRVTAEGRAEGHEPRRLHAAALRRARRLPRVRRALARGRRRHRPAGSGRRDAAGSRDHDLPFRLRDYLDRGGRGRGPVGFLRPHAAVCRRRHEHDRVARSAGHAVVRGRATSSRSYSSAARTRIRSSSCGAPSSATRSASAVPTTASPREPHRYCARRTRPTSRRSSSCSRTAPSSTCRTRRGSRRSWRLPGSV